MNNEKTTQIALLIIIVLLSVNLHFQYKLMVQATKVEPTTIIEETEKQEIKWECGQNYMHTDNWGDGNSTLGSNEIEDRTNHYKAIPGSLTISVSGDPSDSYTQIRKQSLSPQELTYCFAYIVKKTKPPAQTNPE